MARNARIAQEPLHLFEVPPAISHVVGMTGPFYFPGDTRFQGENRPYGALLSYHVAPAVAAAYDTAGPGAGAAAGGDEGGPPWAQGGASSRGPTKIEILDGDSVIRTLKGPAKAGLNRVAWGLERKGVRMPGAREDAPEPGGPAVVPGTYGVRVTLGDHVADGTVEVRNDPRRERPVMAMRANTELYLRGQQRVADVRGAIQRLDQTKETLELFRKRLEEWDGADQAPRDSLVERTKDMAARVDGLLGKLRMPRDTKGIVRDSTVTSRLGRAVGQATNTPYPPSDQRVAQLEWALAAVDGVLAEIDAFYGSELADYREALGAAGFDPLGGG
jgi:hypothetical protein